MGAPTHLAVAVHVDHGDHHVHLLVRDDLPHADQDVLDLLGTDEVVVVQVDVRERGTDLGCRSAETEDKRERDHGRQTTGQPWPCSTNLLRIPRRPRLPP